MNQATIFMGLTLGEKAKLTRISRNLRQIDLASLARVNVSDIAALEKNRYMRKSRKKRILEVLNLQDELEAANA
jgi:transcriptional regulator with XRE-family HTH domain